MKIKLTKEEQKELTDIVNSLDYHVKRAKNYNLATRGLIAIREASTSRILLNHGVAQGRADLTKVEKGELEVSDVKIPNREELAKLLSRGAITKEQQKKILGAKK